MLPLKTFCAALVLLQTSGCAQSQETLARRAMIEQTAPVCIAGSDCDAKWRAAQNWVVNDAGFMIRVATNEVIETYTGQPAQDPRLVVRVVKMPVGDGKYKILIATSCAYDYGCIPDRINAALAFNKAVGAVVP